MKKLLLLMFFFIFLFSCKIPQIVLQDGKKYKTVDMAEYNFYYLTYILKGTDFSEAVNICKKMNDIVKDRNKNEVAIGSFPSTNKWKLGILTNEEFDINEIDGYKIEKEVFASGVYGSMKLKGYPDFMFLKYNTLKDLLTNSGYTIDSFVYEFYTFDTFNNPSIPPKERIGEIMYKVLK